MLARAADEIPEGAEWLYEPKWDGFRAIVAVDDKLTITSRNGQPLLRYFPEIEAPLRSALTRNAVVDGELIIATSDGLDFDSLQLRLHPAESRVRKLAAETPSTCVLFDLLELDGKDLRSKPLYERRQMLLEVVAANAHVVVTPQTDNIDDARRWFSQYEGAGLDGLMAKKRDSTYEPGVRNWVKIKHLRTVDAVVGGYRLAKSGNAVGSLLLGLYDDDSVFHFVGHTTAFSAKEGRELLEKLRPLEGDSFGQGRTPGGPSRWSKGKELEWHSIKPELVCEVSFDHLQGPRFRHAARLLRWRGDKAPRDCSFDQIQRPEDFDLGDVVEELRAGAPSG